MWRIERYDIDRKREWDAFVADSRNSTFLFFRDYMDYHSQRFADYSLMAYRNGKLSALLPANISSSGIHTHEGLTYGGWLWPGHGPDTGEIFELWREWMRCCNQDGIKSVVYKPIPYIYTRRPSEEDRYMLFLSNARLIRTDVSSTIDLQHNPGFNKLQRRHLRSALEDVDVRRLNYGDTGAVAAFHDLLTRCLAERHSAVPIHSVDELLLLMSRFPERITVWGAYKKESEDLLAGICVYETDMCAHCQYIATSEEGRASNALSAIVEGLIRTYGDAGLRYLDFGISNEEEGRKLNTGLNRQKTSYGATATVYQRFEINVSSSLATMPTSLWLPR